MIEVPRQEAKSMAELPPPPPKLSPEFLKRTHLRDRLTEAEGKAGELCVIQDRQGNDYSVHKMGPGGLMYRGMAAWLRHLSLFNSMGLKNDGLRSRFINIESTRQNFLNDREGRTLYTAVRDGEPYAFTWFHSLAGEGADPLQIKTLLDWLNSPEDKRPENTTLAEPIYLDQLATVAAYHRGIEDGTGREWGQEVVEPLVHLATDDFLGRHPEARAVIGGFERNSQLAYALEETQGYGSQYEYAYHNIGGTACLILAAIKPDAVWRAQNSSKEPGRML